MKKQKNITVVAGIIIGMIILSSCEDYFNKVPSDKVRDKDHYKTFIDLQISQAGVFTLLQEVAPNLVVVSELLADMTTINNKGNQYLNEINDHNISVGNPFLNTSGYYRIIIAANEVIEKLEILKKENEQFINDKETIEKYEKLFAYLVVLKSWCYLTLVKLHGEAAYIEKNIVSLPDNLTLQYYSRHEILDRLIVDLDTLSEMNDDKFDFLSTYNEESTSVNNLLMQVVNINAVIGEIYLEKKDYTNAAFHFQKACEEINDNWMLGKTYTELKWKDIFISSSFYSNYTEVMFNAAFSFREGQENPLENWTAPDKYYFIKPTDAIVNLFQQQGDNGDEFRGLDVSYGLTDKNIPYINKYSLGEEGGYNVILYRTADVVLMFAEALNRLGEPQNALALVNDGYTSLKGWSSTIGVRSRVDLSPVSCGELTIECVEDLIMQERAMELAFEGKRWFDLMRVARRRNDPSYLADKVAAKYDNPETSSRVRELLMNPANWNLPFEK